MTTNDIAIVLLSSGCVCLSLDLICLKRRVRWLENVITYRRRRRQP